MERRLEPGLDPLNRVRRELVASKEWRELNKQLGLIINHDTHQVPVSMREVCRRVRETEAYKELQIKISSCLTRHFIPGMQGSYHIHQKIDTFLPESIAGSPLHHKHKGADPCNSRVMDVSIACADLLRNNPHLKHLIKNCLNHPLGNHLRRTAWKILLQGHSNTPAMKRDTCHNIEKVLSLKRDRREIGHMIDRLFTCTPTLSNVAKSCVAVETIKTVTLYWRQDNGDGILDRDLFLCVPFVSVWRETLERGGGNMQLVDCQEGGDNDAIAEVAEVYASFMKILPPTMSSLETEAGQKAMSEFGLQVEELLKISDPKLYRWLGKILTSHSTGKHTPQRKHRNQCLVFNNTLANILHPHVQKMLVGDLSLDVVCYIWDQCFIGRTVPYFQCLHYYITAWLMILRDKLLTCPTVKSISDVLKSKSEHLTIQQFQREIEKSFLKPLSAELRITPILLPSSHVRERPPWFLFSRNSSSLSRPHSLPPPLKQTVLDKRPKTERVVKAAVSSEDRLDREKECLQHEVEMLQRKLEEQHKILSDKIEKERVMFRREVETLQQEIKLLRKRVTRHAPAAAPWQPSLAVTPQSAAWVQSSSVSLPSSPLLDFPPADTSSSTLVPRKHATTRSTDAQSSRQSGLTSKTVTSRMAELSSFTATTADAVSGQLSSSPSPQLSLEEAQEIWLKIFTRFSNGLYLLCHGEGREKEVLVETLANKNVIYLTDELLDVSQ